MADLEAQAARPESSGQPDQPPARKDSSTLTFEEKKAYDLSVAGLTYKVVKKDRKGTVLDTKVLLNNVSAEARAGELLAVVGPSGAGKSTFLDAIAGRIDPSSLEGGILANGKPVGSDFKRLSGYVMQDDELYPMLTVRETLGFSAKLRLPASMSEADRNARVELMIADLGLGSCADTRIGSEDVRGVSGGEKRRVSIGVDLIHDPAVLFLDEPTSGLDSSSAFNVVQNLHDIATKRGRTVVLTIHQPSFRVLNLIHRLLILGRGSVIYHGSYPNLSEHFADFGRVVPDRVNMLEYALDTIEEFQNSEKGLAPLIEFQESRQEGKGGRKALGSSMSTMGDVIKYENSFPSELRVLMQRNVKNILRTNELLINRLVLMAFMALTMGTLFLRIDTDSKGIQSRASYFAFTLAFFFFTAVEALPIFLKERQIYIRETSRGAYRTISYAMANMLVFLPFYFLQVMVYVSVSYWMVGLAKGAGPYFFEVLILFLTLVLANAYVFFWSAFVPSFIIGNTIVSATTSFFFLFSGFFVPRSYIPDGWIWFHYLSNFKYPLDALFQSEYKALQKDNECFAPLVNGTTCTLTPDQVLDSSGTESYNRWADVGIIIAFIIFYRFLFYVALRIQTKSVRK